AAEPSLLLLVPRGGVRRDGVAADAQGSCASSRGALQVADRLEDVEVEPGQLVCTTSLIHRDPCCGRRGSVASRPQVPFRLATGPGRGFRRPEGSPTGISRIDSGLPINRLLIGK